MYKYQSDSDTFLEPYHQLPTSHDMLIRGRVLTNLVKNVFHTQEKKSAIRNLVNLRNASTVEQKLLRYPALPLEDTLCKFMKTAEPLLTPDELRETQEAVERFRTGQGRELQKLLENIAKKEDNWLAHRWQRVAYMQYRDPVTVYVSPGMTFPLTDFQDEKEYRQHTGRLIYGLIKYKEQIDNGEIPVVKMGQNELDNSQFKKVFGTCRIPRAKEDTIRYNPDSKYVVVIYKNHFYQLSVYDRECTPLHPEVLANEIDDIMQRETSWGVPFGVLTTDNRDNWAMAYEELMSSFQNEKAIKVIQNALFTVSLDENVEATKGKKWDTQGLQLIHGGGPDQNGSNRWMDKTIQLIVNPNGMCGFCYEHSPAEGQPIALMMDFVVKNMCKAGFMEGASRTNYVKPTKLVAKSNPCIDKYLTKSKKNLAKLADDLDLKVLHFDDFGKEFCKTQKLSPDSFVQMALQLAFYKFHKEPAAQYESAHLRIFKGGRTETIRSCSIESVNFAKAMLDCNAEDQERAKLLRKAVAGHSAYTKMALRGEGIDRHLLGLKLMAIEHEYEIPELFKTPGYVKSQNWRVSTSQVATPNAAFMCYGPAVPDGYSVCYNPRSNDIILAIGAWKSNEKTSAKAFAVAVRESLRSMQKVLLSADDVCTKSKL